MRHLVVLDDDNKANIMMIITMTLMMVMVVIFFFENIFNKSLTVNGELTVFAWKKFPGC